MGDHFTLEWGKMGQRQRASEFFIIHIYRRNSTILYYFLSDQIIAVPNRYIFFKRIVLKYNIVDAGNLTFLDKPLNSPLIVFN